MAAISPGKTAGPPRRTPKQTKTEKAHRYEPFTKRIAKLKIDPIHKVQQSRLRDVGDVNDISQSHFRAALEEWSELNLTTTFTSFFNKVNNLSESLPQILHHSDKIVELLLEHIEKQDSLALEALLSLVAHLAHDLGQGFEKYFVRTVKLVAKASTTQDDPAVVEACFTCLAWIYKYLSRILVRDLTPLLGVLLPYFSARKEYIRRFTAESLAFLLRKAATLYSRNSEPLSAAVEYIFAYARERSGTKDGTACNEACMTLLADSSAGVDAGLHSSVVDLFRCMHLSAIKAPDDENSTSILEGVVINLIHRTDARGFQPLLEHVIEINSSSRVVDSKLYLNLKLLYIAIAVRGGTRIQSWEAAIQTVHSHMQYLKSNNTVSQNHIEIITKLLSTIILNAPLQDLLPCEKRLMQQLEILGGPTQFFMVCETVARLNKGRFTDILLKPLQQYIVSNWAADKAGLILLLNDLHELKVIRSRPGSPGYITISDTWENSIHSSWTQADLDIDAYSLMQQLLLTQSIHFPKNFEHAEDYKRILLAGLHRAHIESPESIDRIYLGWGFEVLLNHLRGHEMIDQILYERFLSANTELLHLLPFVRALSQVVLHFAVGDSRDFQARLALNMLSSSADLRSATLDLLKCLLRREDTNWVSNTIDLLQEILGLEYTIGNARRLSMLIRRLPQLHKAIPEGNALSELVIYFTLGLLPNFHDQLRKDCSLALSQMMTSAKFEETVLDVLKNWLQISVMALPQMPQNDGDHPHRVSAFACTRLDAIDQEVGKARATFAASDDIICSRVQSAHTLSPNRVPPNSRAIALQALIDIPMIAEKKSKMLVPAFLAAQRGRSAHHFESDDELQSVNTLSPEIEERDWSLRERKLFLQLIASFNNPRTLYRSPDVRGVLEELLTNGDAEVRKSALTALLKWKDKALLAQQDVLLQIAEEKQTTTELSLLLSTDSEIRVIKEQDRSEVLSVLLRLVFGQLISRGSNHGSQEAKRKSTLRLVFRMTSDEINYFLDVVLGRLRSVQMQQSSDTIQIQLQQDLINLDQQYGFLRMIVSMLDILQTQFSPYGNKVFDAVLYCTLRASHQINALEDSDTAPALVRNIRRVGLQCLNLLFENCPSMEVNKYIPSIHRELILPRLQSFTSENSQGVSGLLKLFSIWVRSTERLQYLQYQDVQVFPACWSLLASDIAKPAVKIFVLEDIVGRMLQLLQEANDTIILALIKAEASSLLDSIITMLQQSPPKDLLLVTAVTVQQLVPHASSEETKSKVLQLLVKILSEPNQRLPPHIKGQILQAIESTAQDLAVGEQYDTPFYELLSGLLDFFRDRRNRDICTRLLELIGRHHPDVAKSAGICENLSAQSQTHLGEVDFDRQATAFAQIHEALSANKPSRAMLPVLYSLIFLLRTSEDSATRGNALGCLKHLVSESDDASQVSKSIILGAIRRYIKDDSEIVRADFVEILGSAVRYWSSESALQDMKALLVDNDEEASFFNNILHIQQHRRTRAIRRLVSEIETGNISANNISDYFLPLLQKFTNDDSSSDSAQATKGQSIASMTVLLQWLEWKSFRRVFRQYRQVLDAKSEEEKIDIRLLNHAADALKQAMDQREGFDDKTPYLAKTLPTQDVIAQELKTHFIAKLTDLSHYKDEGEISQRISASVVAIKLINLLPEQERPVLATPIVLDVANVLRSRTQETRDLARNKLAEIVTLLGPGSIQFVLKELRTALTRGYQLHVLSYTLHTILLATAEQRSIGDLDYCLEDLVKVILDDVFGIVGQEKENQDYISSMKEVKSNKSFDSIEILARCTSVRHLSKLILPFEALLSGSMSSKQVRNTDELFRRIGVGISHSTAASNQDLLVFAFELIQAFYKARPAQVARPLTTDERNRDRYLIQKDNVKKVGIVRSSSLLYKIAKFAIDIARSTFARHIELMTPQNVHGFLPIVGDALVEGQEDVKISAMRLLSTVIRLDMPELERDASLYVIEAVKVVKGCNSTNEEAAQAALKTVAAILRDKRDVEVRESDVAYLLKRTLPDLEEPDRQGVTFNFVKAVMARQMQMPEVYELVDKLASMMVTSQSRNSRDAARGVYTHFLLDYPQGKTRWAKQIKFLIKNLEYQYPEGRQSIMEAMSTLISKASKSTKTDLTTLVFLPVIARMSGDDSEKCRELAAALLAQLFGNPVESMLDPMRSWIEQHEHKALQKLGFQTWTIFFRVTNDDAELDFVRAQLARTLQVDDWEVKYHVLETMIELVKQHPAQMLSDKQQSLWSSVLDMFGLQHPWLNQSASKLLSLLLEHCNSDLPLRCVYGLQISEEVVKGIVRNSLKVLKRQSTTEELAGTITPNLLFLSQRAGHLEISLNQDSEDEDQNETGSSSSITVMQYIVDQVARIVRREPPKQISSATRPKIYLLNFFTQLTPHAHLSKLQNSTTSLLIPLLHLTSTNTIMPRSSDTTFPAVYQTLIESAQLCLDALQTALSDQLYMRLVTAATKQAHEIRQERRNKRDIERVTEPERAAQHKRHQSERKKERRKEVKGMHRSNRRKDLGF